jgi:hypothetical protein
VTVAAARTEAVIGFREWIVEDSVLLPPAAGVAWVPCVNTARCYGHGAYDSVPGSACDCGLYAMHAPPDELEDYLIGAGAKVIGAIAAWGQLQVHADGFRAEHARVVALAYPPQATPATIARLAPAAARYEVELVAFEDLPAVASQHGTGVAPSSRRGRRARAQGLPLPRTTRGSAFPASTRGEPAEGWERQVVDPTPAARRATRDQVYLLIGWPRVLFHLRVFEAPGHPVIVIAGNLDGRTGGSVSNNAPGIAAEIAARVLPGEDFALIEHYPLRHDDGAVYAADGFTAVTFDSDGRAQWGQSLSHEAVEALVGQPVVIFAAGAYTAENVERVKSAPHAQLAADAQLPSCPEHGRRGDFYCAEVVMACYARHARQQRRYRPPMPAALAWLRGGRYEGHDEGPVSVVLGAPRVLSSPDGSGQFGWGYGGSGTHELAAAILADWHGHAVAGDLTRDFAGQVIASLPPPALRAVLRGDRGVDKPASRAPLARLGVRRRDGQRHDPRAHLRLRDRERTRRARLRGLPARIRPQPGATRPVRGGGDREPQRCAEPSERDHRAVRAPGCCSTHRRSRAGAGLRTARGDDRTGHRSAR